MATQKELELLLENASEEELACLAYCGCQYVMENPKMPKAEGREWASLMTLIAEIGRASCRERV